MALLGCLTLALALVSSAMCSELEYIAPDFNVEVLFVPSNCTYKSRAGDLMYQDYVGTLSDGRKFDSSYDRGRPFTFRLGVGEVIRGVDMGMRDMCKGEKRRVTVPSRMGYGGRQVSTIPPHSTLHFDIVLTDIVPSIFKVEVTYRPENCVRETQPGDFIRQKYNGTFLDGRLFDSSYSRGLQHTFDYTLGEGGVIKGVDMGMQNMCVGERRKLSVPAVLAYGARGLGNMVPGNTDIYFEKELVEIVKGENKWTRDSSPGCWTVDSTYWMDTVSFYYTIVVYGSEATFTNVGADEPFSMVVGEDKSILHGLLEGMIGMCTGETRTIRIPPELAVGDLNNERLPQGVRLTAEIQMIEVTTKDTDRDEFMIDDDKDAYIGGSLFYKFFL